MKRTLIAAAFAGVALPTVALADCGRVSVAEMNWASGQIITRITEFLMT
ncbi:MAG: hypothetical protein HLUCCO07_03935 [Rhodobacteraceae bacterium HLUCCO07]|nr:MAG: hypothetical protein HLUCCO07_03935 [Rhodobacteraceae bacterium HLUCCO07]